MRVAILSQYYPPEGAAAFYAASLAKELTRRGHSVRVLTGYPNYPDGKLFPGYRVRWRSHESMNGVDILRVPLYIDHSRSGFRRMVNYISFGLSAAMAQRWLSNVDVIYVYATQMTPALGPWMWRTSGGAPYLLHVQDLWPDSITGSSMVGSSVVKKAVERLLNPWLRSVYGRASAIVGIAPTMVETLASRGVDREKLHTVYNWGSEQVAEATSPVRGRASSSQTHILYAGNVGDMQDLETVVRAAQRVQHLGVAVRVVGDGVALTRVRALAEQLGAQNVSFEGRVPMEETVRFYRDADFSLVTLRDLPNFRGTIPSKFQASLAHGVPVITTVQGDLRSLVEDLGVGLTAEAESVESLADAFARAAESTEEERAEMASQARSSYREEFSTQAGVDAIEAILEACSRSSGLRLWATVKEES